MGRGRRSWVVLGCSEVLIFTLQLLPAPLHKTLCESHMGQSIPASQSHSWKKSLFWLFKIIFRLPSCLFSGKHLKVSVQMRSHLQTPKFHVIAKFQGEWQIYYRAHISQEFGLKSFRLKMWKSFYTNVFTNMNSFHVYNKNCSFFD